MADYKRSLTCVAIYELRNSFTTFTKQRIGQKSQNNLKKTTQIYGLGEFLKTYNFLALKIPIFSFFVKK